MAAAHDSQPKSYSYDDAEFDEIFYRKPRNLNYMANDTCLSKTDKASCNDESNKPPCTYIDKPTKNWVYKNINAGVCLPTNHESKKYSNYNEYVDYVNEKSAEAHKIKAELTAKNALEKQEKEKKEKEDKEEEKHNQEYITQETNLLFIQPEKVKEYLKDQQLAKMILLKLIEKAGVANVSDNWKERQVKHTDLTKEQRQKILNEATRDEKEILKKYFLKLDVLNNLKKEKIKLDEEDKFLRELQEKQQEKGLIPHQGGNYVNYKKSKYNYINLKQF